MFIFNRQGFYNMIIIRWHCSHYHLQNISIIFLCSAAKTQPFWHLIYQFRQNRANVAAVKSFLFALWVKGQSCWNGQEMAPSGDSLLGCIQVSNSYLRPLSGLQGDLITIFLMRYIELIDDRGAGGISKGYCKVKLKHKYHRFSFGQWPAPLTVTLLWLESEQQEGCFLHQELLWPTAWEKLWWPPTVFKPTSLTVHGHSCKGHWIPGCT